MIPRIITNDVESALQRQAAVALTGPRQVGKTTLALEIGQARDALYLDLEDRDDRNRLAEPALFLDNAEDRLVILDEIHRLPELFATLRDIIDRGRRKDNALGRFVTLGSASIDLLRQSGETHQAASSSSTPATTAIRRHKVWKEWACGNWRKRCGSVSERPAATRHRSPATAGSQVDMPLLNSALFPLR